MSADIAVFIGNTIALLLIWIISAPLIAIYTYKFHQHQSNLLMQHRDVMFVLSLNGLIVFGLLTHRTFVILSESSLNVMQYPMLIQRFFTGLCIWGTLDLVCVKSYLLYFRHQHHVSIENMSWKKHIDSASIENNWYLRNKNKWGKFTHIVKWLSFPFTISVVIECLGAEVLGWLFMFIFRVTEMVVPISLVIIFTCLQGKFYDIYGIRKEIISQLLICLACGIIYFIAAYTVNAYCGEGALYERVMSIPGNFVPIIAFSSVALSSVGYPLYLLRQQADGNESNQSMGKQPQTIYLLSAIKDPTMLSLFMQHLVKEFNTENLLMIIETVQVKNAYQTASKYVIKASSDIFDNHFEFHFEQNRETKSKCLVVDFQNMVDEKRTIAYFCSTDFMKVEIPNDLPSSDMLTSYQDDIRSQVAALYHKYVKQGSHLEVNLPFALREKVRIFIGKDDDDDDQRIEGDWFWALDSCCLHILSLLSDPFSRFKQTQAFKIYVQSQEYQTAVARVEFVDTKNKPEIYQVSQ